MDEDDKPTPRYSARDLSNGLPSVTNSSKALGNPSSKTMATEAAVFLMGSYRDLGKIDEKVFMRQLVALLMAFPEAVVQRGIKEIVLTSKWLPTIAEIAAALKDAQDPGAKFRNKAAKSYWNPEPVKTVKGKPETKAECEAFLRERGVHLLPDNHPDKRLAVGEWARQAILKPNPDKFKDMAENDPNRLPAPHGWTRLG